MSQGAIYEFKSAVVSVGVQYNWEKPSRQYFLSMANGMLSLAETIEALSAKIDRIEQAVVHASPTSPLRASMANMSKLR